MAAGSPAGWRRILDPERIRRLRLASGLVLFAYVLMHFLAHAVGLISLEAQQWAGSLVSAVWRKLPPMSWALYGALAVHVLLALHLVVRRRSLLPSALFARGSARGVDTRVALQLWLGLALPPLLALHVVANRWGVVNYGLSDSYEYVLLSTFVFDPSQGWLNALGLVATWAHAMIGLHMWVRFRPWYAERPAVRETALALAVAIPLAALAGYLAAGRMIVPLARDGEWMAGYYERLRVTDDAVFDAIVADAATVRLGFLAALVLALAARYALKTWQRRAGLVEIDYLDGPRLRVPGGATLLEISQGAGVPHASVCGGRGRCSTCRVRLLDADPAPPDPLDGERRLLARVRAEPGVRLACQWRPSGHVRVMRLLPPEVGALAAARTVGAGRSGEELEITVMFADLRGFTAQSEDRLPFDVVYLINQFARAAGEAIEAEGGRVDKLLGDGVMALFGAEGDAGHAAAALRAHLALLEALEGLSERLADDLPAPLRLAGGVHTGPAIVGEMGHGSSRGLTAVGDTVNAASRLESEAKAQDAVLAVSAETLARAGLAVDPDALTPTAIRGRAAPLDVAFVPDRTALDGLLRGARSAGSELAAA